MKAYSIDLRQKIVEAYNNQEGSQRQLAKRFRVSLSFVHSLLQRYHQVGTVEPKAHGGGNPPKLSPGQIKVVEQLVAEDNDATLKELCLLLQQRTEVKVSRATMGRIVLSLKLTRKKTFHASERDSERVQKLRDEFWQTIGEVKLSDLVFVDEAGVNIAMSRLYARAKQGQRAHGQRPDGRGKNVTMIGAMALRGLLGGMTFKGGTDTLAFKTYVEKVLVPTLWSGACVVMDNFSSHKVAGIQEAIEAVGARLVYLSPYSPDFSPIENCWSKIKEFLRSCSARTYAELDQAISAAFETVTSTDIIGWFKHCGYCIAPN